MAERFKALVSKTSGVFTALVGSNPTPSAISSPRVLLFRDSKLRRKPSIAGRTLILEKSKPYRNISA